MSHWQDKMIFALSLLDGDREAHRILADMLEEEGDPGLANWARSRKGKRHKRLDFVLALLPHRISLRIACDFLVQSLTMVKQQESTGFGMTHQDDSFFPSLLSAVKGIADWTQGTIADETLDEYRHTVASVRADAYNLRLIDSTMLTLHGALTYALAADSLAPSDPRLSLHHACESRNASRKVAKASRELAKSVIAHRQWQAMRSNPRGTENTMEVADLVQWQIDRVKQVIHEALEQGLSDD